jgi:hypothetical protein
VNADMPGWDSIETVARIHAAAQVAGLVLLALLLIGAALLLLQLRRSGWPEWIDVGRYQIRSLALEIAAGTLLALLLTAALVSYGYGIRQNTLMAAAERPRASQPERQGDGAKSVGPDEVRARRAEETQGRQSDESLNRATVENAQQHGELATLRRRLSEAERERAELQHASSETKSQIAELQRKISEIESQRAELHRKLSETETRIAEMQRNSSGSQLKVSENGKRSGEPETERQLAELRRKLDDTEKQLAAFQRKELQKRLSEQEKKLLIEALAPFPGQKVTIAARLGDEDGKALAEDLVAVFDAARWIHDGNGGISVQRWDRDPVGVEITLNEADARAGRISSGIGALINAVRKLGLSYDNTIYMNRQVPSGRALVKVGRKLPK